MTQNNELM